MSTSTESLSGIGTLRRRGSTFAVYQIASSGVLGLAPSALADFSGSYSVTPPAAGSYTITAPLPLGAWSAAKTLAGNAVTVASVDTTPAPASVLLKLSQTAINAPPISQDSLSLTTVAADSGTVIFDFLFTPDTGNSGTSSVGFLLNGAFTPLAGNSGTFSSPVAAGDLFGFRLRDGSAYVVSGSSGFSSLGVSNFSAPAAGPEASSLGALAGGFVGLVAWREYRRRQRRSANA